MLYISGFVRGNAATALQPRVHVYRMMITEPDATNIKMEEIIPENENDNDGANIKVEHVSPENNNENGDVVLENVENRRGPGRPPLIRKRKAELKSQPVPRVF